MGGVPVKHHSKGKVGRRRSHLALKKTRLFPCVKCGYPTLAHRACADCGFYAKKDRPATTSKPQEKTSSDILTEGQEAEAGEVAADVAPVEAKTDEGSDISSEEKAEEGEPESEPEKEPDKD